MKLLIAFALVIAMPLIVQGQNSQYVFVAETNQTTTLESFSLNPATGVLTPNPGNPFPERQSPTAIAVNPAGNLVFVANAPDDNVSVFAVSSTGALTELSNSPFSASDAIRPTALAVDVSGKFLYVANLESNADANSGLLDVYSIAPNGTLSAVDAYEIPENPVGIFVHPLGKWIYVYGQFSGSYETPQIAGFTIGSNGLLVPGGSPVTTLETFDGPTALVGDANFLFASGGVAGGTVIDTFAISPVDGSISLWSAFAQSTMGLYVDNMAIDSTGSFLFTNVGTFSITSGILALIQPNTSATITAPIFASLISPLLFDGNGNANAAPFLLNSYQIQSGATLEAASGSPYTLAGVPTAIVATGAAPIPTAPAITSTPATDNFPFPVPTNESAQGSIGLTNTGYGPEVISSITINGSPAFSQTNNCPASLASGASCLISLVFAPSALGLVTATLNISGTVNGFAGLSGTGVAPYPIPGISPSSVNFGNTVLSQNSSQAVTISNASSASASLQISSVVISGANLGDFSQSNNCTASVPIGGDCTVTVTFSPLALGDRAATLLIATNSNAGTYGIPLAGEGVTALPQFSLATSVIGGGTIQQTPTGTSFAANAAITLTAVPGANSTFTNWTGVCPGSTVLICAFTITGNTTAIATFAANTPPPPPTYTLSVSETGPGTIVQNPVGASFASGTTVTLTAVSNAGDSFSNWSGACSGTALTCVLTLSANAIVAATFGTPPPAPTPASLAVTPTQQSGNPGGQFVYMVTSTGFSTAPTIAATCSIPMGSCVVNGSTLTVTTAAPSTAALNYIHWQLPLGLGLLALFCLSPRKRKAAFAVAALCFCAACGSTPKSASVIPTPTAGTNPGTYAVQISATNGTTKASAVATLTIQ
jgi:hypothetical protein